MPSTKFYLDFTPALEKLLYGFAVEFATQVGVDSLKKDKNGNPQMMADRIHATALFQGEDAKPVASIKEYVERYPAAEKEMKWLVSQFKSNGLYLRYNGMHVFSSPAQHVMTMSFKCPEVTNFQRAMRLAIPTLNDALNAMHKKELDTNPHYKGSYALDFAEGTIHITWFFLDGSKIDAEQARKIADRAELYLEEKGFFKPKSNDQLATFCGVQVDSINLISAVTDAAFDLRSM